MCGKPFEPAELVFELGAWRWITVRQVETANKRIFYGGFNVPAVCIVWIAGEFASGFDWLRAAREDRDTIPARGRAAKTSQFAEECLYVGLCRVVLLEDIARG
jgi:hypothetical protein